MKRFNNKNSKLYTTITNAINYISSSKINPPHSKTNKQKQLPLKGLPKPRPWPPHNSQRSSSASPLRASAARSAAGLGRSAWRRQGAAVGGGARRSNDPAWQRSNGHPGTTRQEWRVNLGGFRWGKRAEDLGLKVEVNWADGDCWFVFRGCDWGQNRWRLGVEGE